jgi:DNA-binding TFAR19-related protein (PDSD5 family)
MTRLMGGGSRFSYFETTNQKRQRKAQQNHQANQMKTIHECQHRSLLHHLVADSAISLMNRVGPARSTGNQIVTRIIQEFSNYIVTGTEIADENALMILRSSRQHRSGECNTEAATPVAA